MRPSNCCLSGIALLTSPIAASTSFASRTRVRGASRTGLAAVSVNSDENLSGHDALSIPASSPQNQDVSETDLHVESPSDVINHAFLPVRHNGPLEMEAGLE